MLWVKSFHVLFVIAWMSGLFYLPRIFVHWVEGRAAGEDVRRLNIMARKLYRFTHVMMGIAMLLGAWMWFGAYLGLGYSITGAWLHAKLVLVVVLVVYLTFCKRIMVRLESGGPAPSSKMLRWFNEAPLFVVLAILILVIRKPF